MEHIRDSNFSRLFPNTCIIGKTTPSFGLVEDTTSFSEKDGEDHEPALFYPSLFEFYRITEILDNKVPPLAVYLSEQIMETVSKDEKSSIMLNFLLQRSFIEDIQVILHSAKVEDIPDFVWMYCPRVFYDCRVPLNFATVNPKIAIARLLHFFSYDKEWTPELSFRLSKAVYSILHQRDIQDEENYSEKNFIEELTRFYPIPFFFDKEKNTMLKEFFVSLYKTSLLYAKEKKAFLLKRTYKKVTFREAFLKEGHAPFLEAKKAQRIAERAFEKYQEEIDTIVV